MMRLHYFVLAVVLLICGRDSAIAQTRIATIVVTFPTSQPAPLQTMDWTRDAMATVDAFYAEQSYGQFITQSDSFGIYTIPLDQTATRYDIAAAANQAAADAGVDLSLYTRFVYVSPTTNFVAAGYGDLSGVWIAKVPGYPAAPDWRIVSHELGHSLFGLGHAHGTTCLVDAAGVVQCQSTEYGDNLDVMGVGFGHFNIITKSGLGWLPPIQLLTSTGDYLIEPFETAPSGAKGYAFKIGRKGVFTLVMEYRQPIGFDIRTGPADPTNVFGGVEFHLLLNGSEQIEMNAYDPAHVSGYYYYPALTVGQTYCDKEAKVSVTVLFATSAGAMVRMNFRARCQ